MGRIELDEGRLKEELYNLLISLNHANGREPTFKEIECDVNVTIAYLIGGKGRLDKLDKGEIG